MSGNVLRNEGVKKVFTGVAVSKSLKKIYLADNQWNDEESVLDKMDFCMTTNKTLAKYDFRYNNIGTEGKFKSLI